MPSTADVSHSGCALSLILEQKRPRANKAGSHLLIGYVLGSDPFWSANKQFLNEERKEVFNHWGTRQILMLLWVINGNFLASFYDREVVEAF